MTTMHRLDATWAISSKKPGENQGYEITCSLSDRTTAARLCALAENMGTPAGPQAGYPDELPWLTFTGGAHANKPMLGLASIAWSQDQDGTQQPITPARTIWLPWKTAVDVRLDYLSFWRGVDQLHWLQVDGGPEGATGHRTVVIAPQPLDAADEITRLGFEFVKRLAAHLIDGRRVAIRLNRGDAVTLAERLAVLDAVLALLPFGARNCLTVATWASCKAAQAAALTFSDGVQPDQIGFSWNDDTQLPSPRGPGLGYLRELERVVNDGHSLTRIVSHLATRTEPLRHISEVDPHVLQDIRLVSAALDKVQRNEGSVAEVARALQDPLVTEMHVAAFADFLASSTGSSDRKEAKKAKEAMLAHWRSNFPGLLGERCRNGVRMVAGQELTWLELCQEADKKNDGSSSKYLAEALRRPTILSEDRVMPALANLALQYLVTEKTVDYTTYCLLMSQPHVLTRVLSGLLLERPNNRLRRIRNRFHDNIKSIVADLMQHAASQGASWLTPILLAARADTNRIAHNDVKALATIGPKAVSCFVDMLVHRSGLARSVDISWPALVILLDHDFTRSQSILHTLLSATFEEPEELNSAQQARIHALSLLNDDQRHLSNLHASLSDTDYIDAFQHEMRILDGELIARITESLVNHPSSKFNAAPPEVVMRLGAALGNTIIDQYVDMQAQQLQQGHTQDVLDLNLPHHLVEKLAARPGLAWFRSIVDLKALVNDKAPVSDVVGQTVTTLRRTPATNEIVYLLCTYTDNADPVSIDKLLTNLYYHEPATVVALQVRDYLLSVDTPSARVFRKHVTEILAWYKLLNGNSSQPEVHR
ncbi:hypothetical protein [Amycolatopsis magusensis]|uniref:hypothetical protein n=1 Tax=Amycolatopsis magusensis TaxID=882444 RepID=UPI003C2C2BDD